MLAKIHGLRRRDQFVLWFWSLFHPCRISWNEYDHDWAYRCDWYEDPMADCSAWECQTCGEIDEDRGLPEDPDLDYERHLGTWE